LTTSAYLTAWRKANPEKLREHARRSRTKWYAANKVEARRRLRNNHYRSKYGITLTERDQMISDQGGRCAACNGEMVRPVVDHDHTTGRVRGVLCNECNLAGGWANDDPKRLRALADYYESRSNSNV
jgi:hypothetical protein